MVKILERTAKYVTVRMPISFAFANNILNKDKEYKISNSARLVKIKEEYATENDKLISERYKNINLSKMSPVSDIWKKLGLI